MSSSARKKDVLVLATSLVAHVAFALAFLAFESRIARAPVVVVAPVDSVTADLELGLAPLDPALFKTTGQNESPPSAMVGSARAMVGSAARELGRLVPERTTPSYPSGEPRKVEAGAGASDELPHEPLNEARSGTSEKGEPPKAPSLAELGVGKNPFLPGRGSAAGAGVGSETREPLRTPKERVEASLRADARSHEASLGLGPDGPVRAALADAMYASDAPVLARVVFAIRADAKGKVLSIDAVSADQGLPAFQGMARLAREKLARTTLRLPSSAKGANLRVEVSSAWKLPSGHDPGARVELFGQALTKGEGKAATKITLLPLPKVTCISPDDPKNDLKLPLCGITAPLFATDGDPADIGAKPRRIVSTKVVESTIL